METQTQKPNLLYSGEPATDLLNLCEYIDEYYSDSGVDEVRVDMDALRRVVLGMYRDFPFHMGISNASPFKKVAAFTVHFCREHPIITQLPHSRVGDLATHQNAILAFEISRDALFGAKIHCSKRGELDMKNRIKISVHYWMDLISALSKCPSADGYVEHVSLIYEALTYNDNPHISYDKLI